MLRDPRYINATLLDRVYSYNVLGLATSYYMGMEQVV